MITAYAYDDSVYLNKSDLYQLEGARSDEAEPCALPDGLPDAVYRVDGGNVLLDLDVALLSFERSRGRFVMMELTPDKRRYTARAVMEGPRFIQDRQDMAALFRCDPKELKIR